MSVVTRGGGILDRPFTVSNLAVRTSRQKPGERTVSRREGGIRFDGAEVRLFCFGILAELPKPFTSTMKGGRVPRIAVD